MTPRIGLIGGMSWHSTVDYYRLINTAVAERRGGHHSADLALVSVDFAEIRDCQTREDWDGAGRLLAAAAGQLEAAGADVVAICTNLMHKVAPEVEAAIEVPLLHIGDAVAAAAAELGVTRLGVLGSAWVMAETFYSDRLARHGISVVVPGVSDRELVDRIIFDELTLGTIREESRAAYRRIMTGLAEQGAEAIVLACTEIQLLVGPDDAPVPVIDSTAAHARALAAVQLGAGD